MTDARVAAIAGSQFNRISRAQLFEAGLTERAISHRVTTGRLVKVHEGVYAVAPVLEDDDWGRWMGAVLTAPRSVLSHTSAAAAWGIWSLHRPWEEITRPGSGGPRRFGGVVVHRSSTLAGDTGLMRGVPVTSLNRTLLDLSCRVSNRSLARLVREAGRLKLVTVPALTEKLLSYRGRPGSRRLTQTVARYAGLPIQRARSGAEIRALEILRDAEYEMPRLNYRVAGEEADLSWPRPRLIVEIDGGPFHLDRGEDARKQAIWESAGWTVRRLPSDDVYERPQRLFELLAPFNVHQQPL